MKLLIRYLGVVLVDKDLEPGEYVIGRSADVDILLTQDFISRKHGRVFCEDGKWLYQDLRDGHSRKPVEITDTAMIELENDIDLLTEPFLFAEDTGEYDIRDLKTMSKRMRRNRRRITGVALVLAATLAIGAGVYGYTIANSPMDPNALLAFVRPKVVELERVRDDKAIRDLKTYANIQDVELRESVSFCSGFIVAPDVVLTASHCLNGSAFIDMDLRFAVKTHDGKLHLPLRVLGFDAKRDYAFLEVPGLRGYDPLELTARHRVGDTVYTIGNVQGEGIAIRDGILASTTKDPDRPDIEYLRYSAAASPGNSGGPLVDGFGRVVGLVFARTFAENYNLATAAEHLLAGRERFVDDRATKKVSLNLKQDLELRGIALLAELGLPPMSVWADDPEVLRPLDDLTVEIEVPVPLAEYPTWAVEAVQAVVGPAYDGLVQKVREDGKLDGEWSAHVSEAVPLIALSPPARYGRGAYVRLANGAVITSQTALFTPSSRGAYEAFLEARAKGELAAYPAEQQPLVRQEKKNEHEGGGESERASEVVYRNLSFGKVNLMFMGRHAAAIMRLDYDSGDWQRVRRPAYPDLLADLVGEEGIEAHTGMSPLVRPNARREFIIKRFEEEAEPVVEKDGAGRSWLRYGVPMLGVGTLESYCLPLPQGSLCLHNLSPDSNGALTGAARANRLRHELAPIVVEPQFWDVDALIDFLGSGVANSDPTMKDFQIEERSKGALIVRLSTLGVRFTIPARDRPSMLRLNSGVYRQGEGKVDWIALSFEGFFPETNRICTAGVEIEADAVHPSSFGEEIWDWLISARPLGRGKVAMTRARSKKLGVPLMVFGSCQEIYPDSPFAPMSSFYSLKPYEIKHTIE